MKNRQAAVAVVSMALMGVVMILSFQNCGGTFKNSVVGNSVLASAGHSELFVDLTIAGAAPADADLVAAKVDTVRVVVTSSGGQEASFTWTRKTSADTAPTIAALQVFTGTDRKIEAWVTYRDGGATTLLRGEVMVNIDNDQVYATIALSPYSP